MEDYLIPILVTIIPIGFVAYGFIFAQVTRWGILAKTYPLSHQFKGRLHPFCSIWINTVPIQWLINVGADSIGLHFSAIFPLWPGLPPIYAPWSEIEVTRKGQNALTGVIQFRFKDCPDVFIEINNHLGDKLHKEAGDSWPSRKLPDWYNPPSNPYTR